jgi:hypothetical protein
MYSWAVSFISRYPLTKTLCRIQSQSLHFVHDEKPLLVPRIEAHFLATLPGIGDLLL